VLVAMLVAALIFGIVRAASEVGEALHTVFAADAGWIALAALLETITYVLLGTVLRRLAADRTVSWGDGVRIGLIAVGLGNILPAAPVEGMVMAAHELEVKGVSRRRTFVAVGLAQWYFARALFAVGALAARVVAAFGALHASPFGASWPLLLGSGVALALLFLTMGLLVARVGVLDALGRMAARVPFARARTERLAASCAAWTGEVRAALGARGNQLRLLALALGASIADGSCFALSLHATGVRAPVTVLLLAYAFAMIGAFIPLLPAGFGVVETAVPAFLHHAHVPIATALAGVLAYRALATLMPAFVGVAALGQLRLRQLGRKSLARR
jgi:uncharacterized protein (TIRG00374 family)